MAEESDEKESHARSHFPYWADYCVTGRARCHRCTNLMKQDSLKLASLVRSRFHDGFDKHWHHVDCFFQVKRPQSVAEIRYFETLRYEDQKMLERAIQTNGLHVLMDENEELQCDGENSDRKSAAKKRQPGDQFQNYHDFLVDYAKTARSTCNLCNVKIDKKSVRIGKFDYEYEAHWASSDPVTRWFHVECFNNAAEQLEFFGKVVKISQFERLQDEDQRMIQEKVKPPKQPKTSTLLNKKIKVESNYNHKESGDEDVLLKEQSDRFFELRSEVAAMKLDDIRSLLSHMKQKFNFKISSKLIDQATDVLLFGPIQRCPTCKKTGSINLSGSSYICTADLEWGTCSYETRDPRRDMPDIPDSLLERYPWFKTEYQFEVSKRIFPSMLIKAVEDREAKLNDDVQDGGPLDGLTIGVESWNALKHNKQLIQKKVTMLGGKISTVIDRTIFVILSNKQNYESEAPKIEVAKGLELPFATDDFLLRIESKADVTKELSKCLIGHWDGNLEERYTNMNVNQLKHNIKSRSRAHQTSRIYKSSSTAKSQSIVVKDGTVVDPESNLVEVGRVYRQSPCIYNVVLNKVDVSTDKNSFYKMQIIEHETRKEYHVFRAWGRIGCAGVGSNLVRQAESLDAAIEEFETNFEKFTGNSFADYTNGLFRKRHNLYYPIDVDYSDASPQQEVKLEYDSSSSLDRAVQELICFIFDIQRMHRAMKRFELDAEKMPLGKLAENQILEAMDILKELESALDVKPPKRPNKRKLSMLTNKFYTLIPQSFGDACVELISSLEQVDEKNQMLAELKEIEVAYKMTLAIKNDNVNVPVDQYYTRLSCKINVLGNDDVTYKMISDYVMLNHASTHNNYKLVIQQIFQVSREDDRKRFKQHKRKDRALLWHGSRATNFAGILSQGLRIAPPEAPSTGFMFGKGVYFADMSSKAANYCLADPTNDRGLLLLCEVALGKALELLESDANMPANLPEDCHSIKGLGKSVPDPKSHLKIEDELIVPIGKQKPNKGVNSQLLYNEFVVYDESQTMLRYIVDAKFEF